VATAQATAISTHAAVMSADGTTTADAVGLGGVSTDVHKLVLSGRTSQIMLSGKTSSIFLRRVA
jgi:hypothetical protein